MILQALQQAALPILPILAKKPAEPPTGNFFFMMILLFVMMYFLLIRPGQRQRKQQQAQVSSAKKGDKVITAGGIHGTVHHVGERTLTLKLSEGVFVPFEKASITSVKKLRDDKEEEEGEGDSEESPKNDADRASTGKK